ncbi:uncharacterized protein LOC119074271 [Bradysia coprophila]|uniref:uncharacterized protein LOC119074271 n=1 Tax=Bradysia coprophila TaxID=38358 RepID=UPI00187D8F9A|nr:uncharacterized protein LOC119074271 [Bradysia coprophila]
MTPSIDLFRVQVLPYFRYFEESKGIIGGDDAFTEYPKCFRTVDIELNECVLLEDLKIRGFIPIDRHTEEPSYDHIRLFLLALAKYHAISLAIKDQQPEKFQSLTANTKVFIIDRDNESFHAYFNEQVQYASNLLSAEEDAHVLKKLKQFFSKDALDIFVDLIEQGAMEPAAVVSYGDANLNNSLFRYDNSKKPVEICLLDWQESWLGTPIADVVYYLFVSVTKAIRDAHYDHLLKEYHTQLSTHLRRLGSDPEKLFPYELMQEHLRKYGRQAILLAFMALPALTSEPDYCYFDEPADGVTTESDESSSIGYNNNNKCEMSSKTL